jgi:hypothetical protein
MEGEKIQILANWPLKYRSNKLRMIIVLPEAVGAASKKLVGKSGNGSPKALGTVSAAPG